MKKQSLFILLSVILSSCASSMQPAPIEYNNNRSNKAYKTKTNPTISDNGEIVSTGSVEIKDDEIIDPSNNLEDNPGYNNDNHITPKQYVGRGQTMSSKTKIIYHEVQVGETIEEISAKYGVKREEIAILNDIQSPYHLEEFQILKIKQINEKNVNANAVLMSDSNELQKHIEPSKEVKNEKPINKHVGKPVAILQEKKETHEFIVPIRGKIIAKFGDKTDLGINKGISIGAKDGAEVHAAASGKVIYSDYDATYGNLVIIKLNGKNIVTSYAHLGDTILHKGADISQGDLIGYVGSSGKVKEPQLNFGIREGKVAKDPAKFLKF